MRYLRRASGIVFAVWALACAGQRERGLTEPTLPKAQRLRLCVANSVTLPKGHLPDSLQILVGGRRVYDRDSLAVTNADIESIEIIRGASAQALFGSSARIVVVINIDSAAFGRNHPR